MESYEEFLARINTFETKEINPGDRQFSVNPSVSLKVDKNNAFKSFYGDTVVFRLDGRVKKALAGFTDILHKAVPECFSERLNPDTFHVTLHDLSNSPVYENVATEMSENRIEIAQKAEEVQKLLKTGISLKSKYIFNMVNTSLVLGLYPADEENYRRLTELYYIFDGMKKLNYPFTPHITLAYYNVEGFGSRSAQILKKTVDKLNNKIQLEFCVKELVYQQFESMNEYTDVIDLSAH